METWGVRLYFDQGGKLVVRFDVSINNTVTGIGFGSHLSKHALVRLDYTTTSTGVDVGPVTLTNPSNEIQVSAHAIRNGNAWLDSPGLGAYSNCCKKSFNNTQG